MTNTFVLTSSCLVTQIVSQTALSHLNITNVCFKATHVSALTVKIIFQLPCTYSFSPDLSSGKEWNKHHSSSLGARVSHTQCAASEK